MRVLLMKIEFIFLKVTLIDGRSYSPKPSLHKKWMIAFQFYGPDPMDKRIFQVVRLTLNFAQYMQEIVLHCYVIAIIF